MSISESEGNANLTRNDINALKSLNTLWKRIPIDNACGEISELISQVMYCKNDNDNSDNDWSDIETSMDNNVKILVDIENRIKSKESVIDSMIQSIQVEENIVDPSEVFKDRLNESDAVYSNKTSRKKYSSSRIYHDYQESIWSATRPQEVMPSLKKLIPREPNDTDDDDSDIEVSSMRQNFNDPITLSLFQNPYTSKKCKHSYSYESIKEYLGRNTKTCPYQGCKALISMNYLEEDTRLARKVKQYENQRSGNDYQQIED